MHNSNIRPGADEDWVHLLVLHTCLIVSVHILAIKLALLVTENLIIVCQILADVLLSVLRNSILKLKQSTDGFCFSNLNTSVCKILKTVSVGSMA